MNYSKEELEELAQGYFESENTNTLYATSDGQFFVQIGFCKRHAHDRNLASYTFEKVEAAADQPIKMTVKELANHVKTIMDPAELNQLKDAEVKGENRVSAITIIDFRLWQIQKAEELATVTDLADLEARKVEALKLSKKHEVALLDARIAELSNN